MKKSFLIIILCLFLVGCSPIKNMQKPTPIRVTVTEVPCPGVEPKGLSTGTQAYLLITGNAWSIPINQEPNAKSKKVGDLYQHVRIKLEEGPQCASGSAWWQVTTPQNVNGWVQLGPDLMAVDAKYTAAFLPFTDDAVQLDVPQDRKLEAQVRYILADIDLGGTDVFKYYQDQTAAKPDDPELEATRIALEIIGEWGKSQVLANPMAFERKPLRGGTSVVDAGTEFVQPGLDILLLPCDVPKPEAAACEKITR